MANQIQIACVVGTRPELIKMAPVVWALRDRGDAVPVVINTGQHKELLDPLWNDLALQPDYELAVFEKQQPLTLLAARTVHGLGDLFRDHRFSTVVVQGDTTTAACAAMAAFYEHIPVAHVEAGLRTYNLEQPWPEEMNRQLISRIAQIHFAPTTAAAANLLHEHVADYRIHVVGNTSIDSIRFLSGNGHTLADTCDRLGLPPLEFARYVLVTSHRRENHEEGIPRLCAALKVIAAKFPNWRIVFPVHLNPRVQAVAHDLLCNVHNISLCLPVGYADFVCLMKHSGFIITDSGGIQEEAPALGIRVLVARDTTERMEAIDAGYAKLVGCDSAEIIESAQRLIQSPNNLRLQPASLFGDGYAGPRIANILASDAPRTAATTAT